jgi:hypothetical protein
LSDRCTAIKTAFEAGGISVQVADNILVMMWEKFLGFACNATVASLTRSRAGVIARTIDGAPFVSAVIGECVKVVTALGYPPLPAFNTAGIITGVFSQPDSTYGPSLLIDMEDDRPTEGEHCRRSCRTRRESGDLRTTPYRGHMQSSCLRDQPEQSEMTSTVGAFRTCPRCQTMSAVGGLVASGQLAG